MFLSKIFLPQFAAFYPNKKTKSNQNETAVLFNYCNFTVIGK
jgi:hypothetical protein